MIMWIEENELTDTHKMYLRIYGENYYVRKYDKKTKKMYYYV